MKRIYLKEDWGRNREISDTAFVRRVLLLCLAGIVLTFLPLMLKAQGSMVVNGGYEVDFVDYEHDLENCRTYFFYELSNNNVSPSISHFGFGETNCSATCMDELPSGYYGSWSYDNGSYDINPGGANAWQGNDLSSGICGLKFNKGLTSNNTQRVYICVDGIQLPGLINLYVKASTSTFETPIPGPAECSSECDALNFYKNIRQDTIVEGGTVTYRFTFDKIWNKPLENFTFIDTLKDGLVWDSEPINLVGGIIIGGTSVMGNSVARLTIGSIPQGVSSFELKAKVPNPYNGQRIYSNQAWVTDLPGGFEDYRVSDYPETGDDDDPTILVILQDDECIGNWNMPNIEEDFEWDNLSVTINTTRPLVNVVLRFGDGSIEIINGLSGYNGNFAGTGDNEGKCLQGVWIRTACNASGEGPGYGQYYTNIYWDGFCITDGPPMIQPEFEHGSTVITNGPSIDIDFDIGTSTDPVVIDVSGGHNTTGVGIVRPDIPAIGQDDVDDGSDGDDIGDQGQDDYNGPGGGGFDIDLSDLGLRNLGEDELLQAEVDVWPNPVRAHGYLNVRGLDDNSWNYHVYSINGSQLASGQVINERELDISRMHLKPGIYILQFENGTASTSEKIIVQ